MSHGVILTRFKPCPSCGSLPHPRTTYRGTVVRHPNCNPRTCRIAYAHALAGGVRGRFFEPLPADDRHVHKTPR